MVLPAWFVLFLVFLVFEQAANVLGKHFALSERYRFAVFSLLSFSACELPWIFSLRTGLELSKGAVLFSVVSNSCQIGRPNWTTAVLAALNQSGIPVFLPHSGTLSVQVMSERRCGLEHCRFGPTIAPPL